MNNVTVIAKGSHSHSLHSNMKKTTLCFEQYNFYNLYIICSSMYTCVQTLHNQSILL